MRVVLLGATDFVGSALLKEALDRGHAVTAIVRGPEKLPKRDGLIVTTGDVYDTAGQKPRVSAAWRTSILAVRAISLKTISAERAKRGSHNSRISKHAVKQRLSPQSALMRRHSLTRD